MFCKVQYSTKHIIIFTYTHTVNLKGLKRPQNWGQNGDRKLNLFGGQNSTL